MENKKASYQYVYFDADKKKPRQTNSVFYSYDKETAVLHFKLIGLDLKNISEMKILFVSSDSTGQLTDPIELAYQDVFREIDAENNIATYTLPEEVIGYVGYVAITLYFDCADGSTADSSEKFVVNLEASQIDGIAEVVEVYYFDAFNDMVEKVREAAQDKIDEISNFDVDSLKGPPGKSAYEVAIDAGFVGTEEEWLESLEGPRGDPGADGISSFIHTVWADVNEFPFFVKGARLNVLRSPEKIDTPSNNSAVYPIDAYWVTDETDGRPFRRTMRKNLELNPKSFSVFNTINVTYDETDPVNQGYLTTPIVGKKVVISGEFRGSREVEMKMMAKAEVDGVSKALPRDNEVVTVGTDWKVLSTVVDSVEEGTTIFRFLPFQNTDDWETAEGFYLDQKNIKVEIVEEDGSEEPTPWTPPITRQLFNPANIFEGGNTRFPTGFGGAVATITKDVEVPEWGATDAYTVQITGGTSNSKATLGVRQTGSPASGSYYYSSNFHIRNNHETNTLTVYSNGGVSVNVPSKTIGYLGIPASTQASNATLQFTFQVPDASMDMDFTMWNPEFYAWNIDHGFTVGQPNSDSAYLGTLTDENRVPRDNPADYKWNLVKGPEGLPGQAATIQVGTVTTGDTLSITNSGTDTQAIFDFTFPNFSEGGSGSTGYEVFYLDIQDVNTLTPALEALLSEKGYTQSSITYSAQYVSVHAETGQVGVSRTSLSTFSGILVLLKEGNPILLYPQTVDSETNRLTGTWLSASPVKELTGVRQFTGKMNMRSNDINNTINYLIKVIGDRTVNDPDGSVVDFHGVTFQRVKSQYTYSYWSDTATFTQSEISIAPLDFEEVASVASFPELALYQGGTMIVTGYYLSDSGESGNLWLTIGNNGIHIVNQDPQNTLIIPVGSIIAFNKMLLLGPQIDTLIETRPTEEGDHLLRDASESLES